MKKLVLISAALFVSNLAGAAEHGNRSLYPTSRWTCQAQGKRMGGGPMGGENYEIVSASGADRYEASNKALSRCSSSGLQMCMIINCYGR